MKKMLMTSVWMVALSLMVCPGYGQDKKETQKKEEPKKEAPKDGAPQMSPEEMAMWEQFMKDAAPGEHHKVLGTMVGKWTLAGKHRMAPEQPWESWTAKSEFNSILDGRFVTQTTKGDSSMGEGMPVFEGYGLMGYDNIKKVHTASWMDNFGTYAVHSDGTCSGGCKEITMSATFPDPMNNYAPVTEKWVYKFEGNDKFVFSTHRKGADGKEFQSMEITYTRAK